MQRKPRVKIRQVSPHRIWHNKLMSMLREKLADPNFFNTLPQIEKNSRVRKIRIGNLDVAIKFTSNLDPEGHGINFESFRKIFFEHQRAVRNGELTPRHYKLRSIRVFGRIGNYLIMELVKGMEIEGISEYPEREKFLVTAYEELNANFSRLLQTHRIGFIPQTSHMIIKKDKNGRWIIYLPYDKY